MVAIGYVSPIPNDPTKVLKAGDTMTGDLVLSGDPTVALGASPKQYVDQAEADAVAAATAAATAESVSLSGDTMTGPLILSGAPSTGLQASTKTYVDAGDAATLAAASAESVSLTGDTMTGDLLLSGSGTDLTVQGATTVSYQGVTANVGEALSTVLSTGVVNGGFMTVNAGNPAAVDFGATVAYIMDPSTASVSPTLARVVIPAQTIALAGASLTRLVTWWVSDAAGTISQVGPRPTEDDLRTVVVIGVTGYDIGSGVIFVCKPTPTILSQPANQLADLMNALGPFSIDGNRITPNGANLMVNQSAGRMFSNAFDYDTDVLNPHYHTTFAQTPAQFQYATRVPNSFQGLTNLIDPTHYDAGGVITLVGGGAGSSTVQRVYLFATETASAQLAIQYGQVVYSSLANARAAIGSGVFLPNTQFATTGTLIAYIAVTRTATNLSDTAQALIVTAGKFATP